MRLFSSRLTAWVVILVTGLGMSAAPALAAEHDAAGEEAPPARTAYRPSADAMAVDAVVVRPVGLVTTVLGAAVFVVSLPFTAASGSVAEAGDTLVGDPARYTFKRRLGEFRK